jgi:hypothetical protein
MLPPDLKALPYVKPVEGEHYAVLDGVLPNARAVVERCWGNQAWLLGAPHLPESWPGMRAPNALSPDELAAVTEKARVAVKAKSLYQDLVTSTPGLSHNFVQIVGGGESIARPHVDSRALATWAGVLYLHPYPPTKHAGTSLYRLVNPDGSPGGNLCPPPYLHLNEALGVDRLPITAFEEEVELPYVFNRLVVYRADLIHSATAYFGHAHQQKRISVTFFWKA